jgi:transposase
MYPEWVLKHKVKGSNISCINGRYYLYEVGSVWNKEKGRAQKITKGYLGRITEEGLIKPKGKTLSTSGKTETMSVKEYGASSVITELGADILSGLRESFPEQAETLFTLAALRVVEPNPFKRAEQSYRQSYLSETFKGLKLSGKDISGFLKEFGAGRERMVEFMRGFIRGTEHILFDGTGITSKSERMSVNRLGYNAGREYEPQINLLYAFALDSRTPVYYRIVPGNVREVSAFKLSVAETGLRDMVVVADKGFGSKANFDLLEECGIKYIVPLRRNNGMFDSGKLEAGDKSAFDGYFLFGGRPIWHYSTRGSVVYLDNDLRIEEEKDYILRVEKGFEGYTKEGFIERQYKFGAIALRTNLDKTPQEIYWLYKERREIEQSFDFLKNLLEQDKSYMQNERSLEAWAFINHLALMINYKIYNLLKDKGLLPKYSVFDFIYHLKYIFKIRSDSRWLTSEISSKTSKMLTALNLHIT